MCEERRISWLRAALLGVGKDAVEAAKWYRKAAEQGDAAAQFNLGWMYANGLGVRKDEIEALAWYSISAISGNERSTHDRDELAKKLGPQFALEAQERSRAILQRIEPAALTGKR